MADENPNLELFRSVWNPPTDDVQQFTHYSGKTLNTINAMKLIEMATEVFGPCGIGWGFEEIEHKEVYGGACEDVGATWHCHLKLWYRWPTDDTGGITRGEVQHWGCAPLFERRGDDWVLNHEAPKSAMTNAMSKCLSLLGFGASIWMNYYDTQITQSQDEAQQDKTEEEKQQEEFERTLKLLADRMDEAGCETDEDGNCLVQWALANSQATWARVCAGEIDPRSVLRAFRQSNVPVADMIREAKSWQVEIGQRQAKVVGKKSGD